MLLPEPVRCAHPGCDGVAAHLHHIIYEPSVTKRLCVRHHEEITIINGIQARNIDGHCPTSIDGGFGMSGQPGG